MTPRILLVASEHPRRRLLEDLLADQHAVVRNLAVGGRGLPWNDAPPDLLVVAAFDRTVDAVALVQRALGADPDLSVLVSDEPARWPETLRHRPGLDVTDLSSRAAFRAALERLLERRRLLRQAAALRAEPVDRVAAEVLVGDAPAVREAAMLLERLMKSRAHVILAGEPGTLRRRVLEHLHRDAGDAPSVLQGDVDALSPAEQGAVLRLVQHGRRVVACATPRFSRRVQDGSFRTDLYYALGGTPVTLVPLRERAEDLPRLARASGLADASEDAYAALAAYGWPGNTRELELVSEHALLLAGSEPVDVDHLVLPEPVVREVLSQRFFLRIPEEGVSLEEVEREVLRQTLAATGANVAEAARRLDVGREKLRYRLRRHGLGR